MFSDENRINIVDTIYSAPLQLHIIDIGRDRAARPLNSKLGLLQAPSLTILQNAEKGFSNPDSALNTLENAVTLMLLRL